MIRTASALLAALCLVSTLPAVAHAGGDCCPKEGESAAAEPAVVTPDEVKAALADNAASLAAAEHDREALDMAIGAYEELWNNSPTEQQRAALETALNTLRNYQF